MDLGDKIMGRDMENLYKWRKENIKKLILDLNKTSDKDVIDHLDKQPNKKEYLIGLVRKDMEGSGK